MTSMSSVLICPCGRWHKAALRATEKYVQRFRCGLRATLKDGENVYRYKGREALIVELAAGQTYLYMRLSSGLRPDGED